MTGWEAAGEHALVGLSSGRLSVMRYGPAEGPLVICVPGLSQDERSLDVLGRELAGAQRRVIAVSLRGRGRSDTTAAGTYGLPAHARDIVELADILGAPQFDLVGWSMGGLVGMQLAAMEPQRLRRLVLLDIAGKPDEGVLAVIAAGIERLGAVYPTREAYVERVVASGVLDGCAEEWTDYLSGDLVAVPGGFSNRTNREAVIEDAVSNSRVDPYQLWRTLSMPVLLVRATVPLTEAGGVLVTAVDAERFSTDVPAATVVEVAANHYCIAGAGQTLRAVREFLDGSEPGGRGLPQPAGPGPTPPSSAP